MIIGKSVKCAENLLFENLTLYIHFLSVSLSFIRTDGQIFKFI